MKSKTIRKLTISEREKALATVEPRHNSIISAIAAGSLECLKNCTTDEPEVFCRLDEAIRPMFALRPDASWNSESTSRANSYLFTATVAGHLDLVEFMLDGRSRSGSVFEVSEAFLEACRIGSLAMIELFLPFRHAINIRDGLNCSISGRNRPAFLMLLQLVSTKRNGETHPTALDTAVRLGDLECVKDLVAHGFSLKRYDSRPFVIAVEKGYFEVANFLAPLSRPEVVRKYL